MVSWGLGEHVKMIIRRIARQLQLAATTISAMLWSMSANAAWTLNMRQGVTPLSREIYGLHMKVLWICVVIGIVVFGVMFWSILHHRKSKGAQAAHFHENTSIEIAWTLIPFCILIFLAVPATKALINIESTGNADLTIKVTGYQWEWEYEYIEDGIHFFSALESKSNAARHRNSGIDVATVDNYLLDVNNPVVVPVGKKIRILTTANDVIHSWWVPDLGIKRDAIPGFINESWARIDVPGTYRGQCAELCGKDHGFMPIVVVAKEEADYKKWVEETKAKQAAAANADNPDREWTKEELMAKGEAVYNTNCATCHQADGKGMAGVKPIAGSPIASGDVADHIDIVMYGKPGTAMVGWGQLTDVEIASVITFQRNSFGNSAGDLVQPSAIKKDYR
jgi:cytochrome c oxidase subunit 2